MLHSGEGFGPRPWGLGGVPSGASLAQERLGPGMALGEFANREVFVQWVAQYLFWLTSSLGYRAARSPLLHVNLSSFLLFGPSGSVPGLRVNQEGLNLSPLVDLTSVLTETLI